MSEQSFASAWQVEMQPDPADIQALRDKLRQFNIERAAIDQGQDIGLFLRDESGEIVAGAFGRQWGYCLEIVIIWISEALRGQGIGRRLVSEMEEAGRAHGARTAMLETFSFQAPRFYERLGYETFGRVDGYGQRYSKYFMRKELQASADRGQDTRRP